ncbi:NRAMP (natural resistance-associated macrophage protein)-like metal ion transporter [Sphingomonas vulcanisoli]|uniref:NRAMP (Natural resistance-associated macrophage protein)-like metal ion transporter n=1 Tax=Sphingomonas vulcanisoli TaxID=1658060 RepID=A0ABX0TV27_9SPHN|nr:NRAMP (natural resistance-associated macrophage protein)-like metal ion transporter [Sphingomonas vulcanisoli]
MNTEIDLVRPLQSRLLRLRSWRDRPFALIRELGPGLVTGAADDDPSGIATYSQGGAAFGMGLLWTLVLTYPLMSAVQLVSAHIGRVTGQGLGRCMRNALWRPVVLVLVALLFVANTINVGADLAAMGATTQLVVGGYAHLYTLGFALLSLVLQVLVPYRRYARILKWMTLSLFAYVALLFTLHLVWRDIALGLFVPHLSGHDAVVTVVAIFGTTISPYLFFWQSAQEVEEVTDHLDAHALLEDESAAPKEFARMRFDTWAGMGLSNIVAIAIMIGTGATLHLAGITTIGTAADAARALQPIAGRFASLLFCFGIVGTGLLAVPVLAGSAAYAIAEAEGWESSLGRRFSEARGFYTVIACATLLGVAIDWSPLDPMRALFWSAVINGVVAVPLMVALMAVACSRRVMGVFRATGWLATGGWAAAAMMGVAVVLMFAG